MKKYIVIIFAVTIFVVSIFNVFSQEEQKIVANIVDYKVYSSNGCINNNLQYPLILNNDVTYISIRDMADVLSRRVVWNDRSKEIFLRQKDDFIIKKEETALAIGKAFIEEYFYEKINNNTKYSVIDKSPTALWADECYVVSVQFNYPGNDNVDIIDFYNNADARVKVNPVDGSCIIEQKINKAWVKMEKADTSEKSGSPSDSIPAVDFSFVKAGAEISEITEKLNVEPQVVGSGVTYYTYVLDMNGTAISLKLMSSSEPVVEAAWVTYRDDDNRKGITLKIV